MANTLYYGDNLQVLRESIAHESVDLVYLDPPFNSAANYNVLFSTPKGQKSDAQVTAFHDTWHWGEQAEHEFTQVLKGSNTQLAELVRALRLSLGTNDMLAYLVMMAVRLVELRRVMKDTATLYLHCDPTASHYLKIILDGVFGIGNYRNEIIWKRSNPKSHITRNFPTCTDTILRYTKSDQYVYHQPYEEHDAEYVQSAYRLRDEKGHYQLLPLLNPNDNRPNLKYEFLGVTRVWRWTKERMQQAYAEGIVVQQNPGSVPRYKKYLTDSKGKTVTNCWTDIPQVSSKESLGYPTQKPLSLLERIIEASSTSENDVVLDPFCGCGTAVHAAQRLGRQWIGIDITHLAIGLIEKRLRTAFPDIAFKTYGTPKDIDGARNLALRDKYEFQHWACGLVNAQTYRDGKKGADGGIDGIIYFQESKSDSQKIIVSIKGGEGVSVAMLRDLGHVIEREKAAMGLFVTLAPPTKPMIAEAASARFYESPTFPDRRYPRLQILTIEGLMNGTEQPRYPDMSRGELNFKKATRESRQKQGVMDV